MYFIDLIVCFNDLLEIFNIFVTPKNTIAYRSQIYQKLTIMNVAPNLPDEPNYAESKIYEAYDNTRLFVRNFMYLVKKVFML